MVAEARAGGQSSLLTSIQPVAEILGPIRCETAPIQETTQSSDPVSMIFLDSAAHSPRRSDQTRRARNTNEMIKKIDAASTLSMSSESSVVHVSGGVDTLEERRPGESVSVHIRSIHQTRGMYGTEAVDELTVLRNRDQLDAVITYKHNRNVFAPSFPQWRRGACYRTHKKPVVEH